MHKRPGLGEGSSCQGERGLTAQMGELRPGARRVLTHSHPIGQWHSGTQAQGLADQPSPPPSSSVLFTAAADRRC